ncbi:hypothetical protein LUZ60_014237 [Juncus effusus]|nr:hypothetical protein LUZ60_014237 [Juncus effusus]
MASSLLPQTLSMQPQNLRRKSPPLSFSDHSKSQWRRPFSSFNPHSPLRLSSTGGVQSRPRSLSSEGVYSTRKPKNYEFADTGGEIEMRFEIGKLNVENPSDIFVDTNDTSLLIRVKSSGILQTLIDVNQLFERVKSSETIWYIDEEQLVVNLKKVDKEVKWPDIMESWETLTEGILQFINGISIYIIGNSTEINEAVAKEIAAGIGFMPICTSELLELYAKQSIDSWVVSEGPDSVAEAEGVIFENLSSQVRTVVGTLGGKHGASSRFDRWRHLHAGFSVWIDKSDVSDEVSAKEEARKNVIEGSSAYAKSDVIVKIGDWDPIYTRDVAKGCLNALKQLNLSDKKLSGKKSLYIRLGCRGDWPDIMPPGWDPASGVDPTQNF